MAALPESTFPTIEDARDVLSQLVEKGFGALPVQLVIVPASSLAVLARDAGHSGTKPALMIEITARDGAECGLLIASVDTLQSAGMN